MTFSKHLRLAVGIAITAAVMLLALAVSAPRADAAWHKASNHPNASGWGYSQSIDRSGNTPKWAYVNGEWQFGWRPDGHQVYITPFGSPGWSWTWCTCNGGTWSAAYTRDLVIWLP